MSSGLQVTPQLPVIPLNEVRRHSSYADCWIIIRSKVYDVSSFLGNHPGGSAIILKFAGSDATAAYDEIHAPGMLEQTLAIEQIIGLIKQEETETLLLQEKQPSPAIHPTSGRDGPSTRYVKPELQSLISAHDFEDVARNTFTQKAWAFYSSAATDLITHHANTSFWRRIMLRPRVMRNVRVVKTSRSIMGCPSRVPFFMSPAAMAKMGHEDGELALARGCAKDALIQIISSNASYPLANIIDAGIDGQSFFLQLYVNSDREKSTELLRRAKALGVKAVFVTVDAHVPGKREADERIAAEAYSSPMSGAVAGNDKKGGGMGRLMGKYVDSTLGFEDIAWIKETSQLPVVLKGIQSAADARKAVECGVQGILVSNHGGRSLDTAQPTLLTLLELHKVYPEIFSMVEVYVDGGINRGADILKALALGATAVGVGRPYLYSLAYGAEGVEHLTEILKDELETSMRLAGITHVDQAHPGLLNTQDVDYLVPESEEHPWIAWRPMAKL